MRVLRRLPPESNARAQRYRFGQGLRKACPRADQGVWKPREDAIDPLTLLEESDAGRIAGLIPLRYARMAQSPFGFFRGSAIIQARDLRDATVSGLTIQLCGDCHLSNFGGFGTPERNLIFDINDFDESFPGPWEWDLKRLAVSFVLAARHRNFGDAVARDAVAAAVGTYRVRTAEYAQMSPLDIWYTQIDFNELRAFFRRNSRAMAGLRAAESLAHRRTSEAMYPKLTTPVGGSAKIIDDPPLIYHFHEYAEEWDTSIHAFFERYRRSMLDDRRKLFDRYRFADIAIKVVGVGSVGTRCAVALFLADALDPLFLQIKEARRSVLESTQGKSRFTHQGERVVAGQRLMQAASDIFLGWAEIPHSQDYYVRQLRDMKVSANVEEFSRRDLADYARMCGWALARAHAKAGDAATVAGYIGSGDRFDRAIRTYAVAYADQVQSDYARFLDAIRSGRFQTQTGDFSEVEFAP
ncbi:MAG: DUF2252 domain-containing protein [Candidatus Eremiobacteraeota bacterium]|nr:DUF2252 domain-containing protein [Candidatus Eremiobacteraeota bacterium]